METYDVLDLFSGIGGIRLGLEQTGRFRVVHACEIDKNACKTYEANFGHNPAGDVTKIIPGDLPRFDVIAGGFPCQSFSLAGNRRGFDDMRGTLFFHMAKIMEARRPKAGLFENVPGLINHDGGRTLKRIIDCLRNDLGYRTTRWSLNAKDFGVPQNRSRIYIIAVLPEFIDFLEPPIGHGAKTRLSDILEKEQVDDKYYLSAKYLAGLERHKVLQAAKGRGFGYEIRPRSGIANAVVCGGMGKERNLVIDARGPSKQGDRNEKHVRKMTPREWARLQGFPEDFKLPKDAYAYKQFGNSVAVPVIRAIGDRLAMALDKQYPEGMGWSSPT